MNEGNGTQNFFALFRSLWRLIRGKDDRWRKVRWLFSLLRPYRRQVLMMLAALVLSTVATLAPPFLVGKAIQVSLNGDSTALLLIIAGFLGAALIGWGTGYAQTYLVGWVGERALQDLRIRIFTHLQGMSIGFFTRNRPG
ncbi:MAG TPA: ABC transporter transmembrane domain-containing protein, partial [Solirubrobacterales bacterium]